MFASCGTLKRFVIETVLIINVVKSYLSIVETVPEVGPKWLSQGCPSERNEKADSYVVKTGVKACLFDPKQKSTEGSK